MCSFQRHARTRGADLTLCESKSPWITLAHESGASEWSLQSKEMNVLRDFPRSRFALRVQFCCVQYSTLQSMLLARQVNVQQCVSFLFVSPTSSLSSLERWPSPYCLNVPADVCACLRGRKRGHSVLYNWVLPLCGPESYVFVTYASVTMAWAWSQTWYSVHSVMEFYAAAQKTPIFMNDGVNQLGHCKN